MPALNLKALKKSNKVICGVDVGTSKVAVVMAQKNEHGHLEIIGFGSAPSNGVRKGTIVSIEDVVSSISTAVEEAEQTSGVSISHAIVSIGGAHIASLTSKGVVAIASQGNNIREEDVYRAITASQAVTVPANHEIIHTVPQKYKVDEHDGVKDPVGLSGVRLEVASTIIYGFTPAITNLSKCVFQAGVDIDEMVAAPLASSKAVLSDHQKELGVMLVDIGAGTTSLACFEEGDLLYSVVLPVGSAHITNDIAIGLRCSVEAAEKIKLQQGAADPKEIKEGPAIEMSRFEEKEEGQVSRKYLAQIIHARVDEILNLISEELKKIGKSGMLPAGIVFTGGGAKLPGLMDVAKAKLKLPVHIGSIHELKGVVDKIDDPSYAGSIGLVIWGAEEKGSHLPFSLQNRALYSKMRKWFRSFLPN